MRVGLFSVLVFASLSASWRAAAMPAWAAPRPTFWVYAAESKLFHGVGVITAVDAGTGVVTIDHSAIPGLMEAMEMPYATSPTALARGLKKGDKVEFEVDGKTYKIEAIKRVDSH